MTLSFSGVVFDSADPATIASFWAQVLGWSGREDGDRGEVVIFPRQGETTTGPPSIVFQPVPEGKTVKNRVHLDLSPGGGADQDAEVERLEALGAHRVDVGQGEGLTFVVLADPEGNELCVLRD
ncbi:VOC family protein [Luteimicrobium subarcticum]|uniref:Putative enzyme related to lactoylglutathione lyase n=1 Tax=Luteimicrobium subarcticum TaxID=620910 RepID=A0A2M8WR41_9MICO|nr:VOC family protein [Luteimicrobium subarcticum]PJI93403.1 putative enzyme related to lactoylglutathione lyase [Luteimicrobium subarcticum]